MANSLMFKTLDDTPGQSELARLSARGTRNQQRMIRGILAGEMRAFHRAQRQSMRKQRQRQPTKQVRALRSLAHELAYVDRHRHGTGTHGAQSMRRSAG